MATKCFSIYLPDILRTNVRGGVFIDDSSFYLSDFHNGYELEYVFPNICKPKLLSQFFSPDVWNHMINLAGSKPGGTPVIVQMKESGIENLIMLAEGAKGATAGVDYFNMNKIYTPPNRYNSKVAGLDGSIYYYGYWINPSWFNAYKDMLQKELTFSPISDEKNKQYERAILQTNSVGVHIRRGDFVALNWALPEEYYQKTFMDVQKMLPHASYFIFSDDIGWCKNNYAKLGIPKNTVFVEGNYDRKNNYIDMQLMTMCKVLIVGSSSFSYLASLLNTQEGFTAINVRNPLQEDISLDLY